MRKIKNQKKIRAKIVTYITGRGLKFLIYKALLNIEWERKVLFESGQNRKQFMKNIKMILNCMKRWLLSLTVREHKLKLYWHRVLTHQIGKNSKT